MHHLYVCVRAWKNNSVFYNYLLLISLLTSIYECIDQTVVKTFTTEYEGSIFVEKNKYLFDETNKYCVCVMKSWCWTALDR